MTHTARADVPGPEPRRDAGDVAFTTSDGLRLEGWFVPSRNGATVIVVPRPLGPAEADADAVRHGYGVLLFDRRGEGASEGDPNAFGWVGDRDLHAAPTYLRSRPDVDPERIGGIGLSVGGEMLIHAAAHSDAFKAIVSEGGSGQSFRDGYANHGLLDAIVGDAAVTLATALFTNTLPPPSLKSEVAEDRAERRLPRLRREGPGRLGDEAEQGLLRGRRRAEADLGGPERPAHRRHHHRARRVRAARDRLLRPHALSARRSQT